MERNGNHSSLAVPSLPRNSQNRCIQLSDGPRIQANERVIEALRIKARRRRIKTTVDLAAELSQHTVRNLNVDY